MGSFVYMIARDDADIIEEKRPEFEERLEKVFNAAGMMEQEHLTLFGKGIRALRPVRIENGYTTFWVRVSGSYAFAIKRISELYNRDFWELYASVAGMNKKRSFSENLWSEKQSLLISGISTAEFVNQSPDDMLYYWTPDGDIEVSEDIESWFGELRRQFDEYVAEWQQIPKIMRYIVDDLLFADSNYANIQVFSEFLEETMDNISDVRYHILWRIFHDMIHDPNMLKEGSVILDKESLANGKKKLRYSWKMTDTDLKRNKARMTVKRYLSLISNKELRRKVFGF